MTAQPNHGGYNGDSTVGLDTEPGGGRLDPGTYSDAAPAMRGNHHEKSAMKGQTMSDGNSHFLMAIGRIDGGLGVETADQMLREVLSAVNRTGKKGTVSIALEVVPNGETGFAASVKVAAKAPSIDFGKSFFFMDRDGDLTRNAPQYVQETLLKMEDKANG